MIGPPSGLGLRGLKPFQILLNGELDQEEQVSLLLNSLPALPPFRPSLGFRNGLAVLVLDWRLSAVITAADQSVSLRNATPWV